MSVLPNSLRNAAVLIEGLDTHSADALLERLDPAQAARIRQAVVELGPVSADERDRVLRDFLRSDRLADASECGIELDDYRAEKLGTGGWEEPAPDVVAAAPFRFLHEAAGQTLATLLKHEHPQTIAVVVSHLLPARAADLIAHLPAEMKSAVLSRVATLDETDPQVLQDVEQELQSVLAQELRTLERRSAGVAAVRAILEAAHDDDRDNLLSNLQQHDRQLATEVSQSSELLAPRSAAVGQVANLESPRSNRGRAESSRSNIPRRPTTREFRLTFKDLARLDDHSLARVLQAADPAVTVLALTGAQPELVERIASQLSPREAKLLRKRVKQPGPLRLSDVDGAQQHLARMAGELLAHGEIQPPGGRFAVAA